MDPTTEHERWQDLVTRLNDSAAPEELFRRIFQAHYRPVYDFFLHRGFSAEESRDLAQETFVNIFRGIQTFRGEASLGTWIVRVAANVWRNELRRRSTLKRAVPEVALEELTREGAPEGERRIELAARHRSPLREILDEESRKLLQEAVGSLPPQMRRCIQLRVAQDLKYHEIAATLQLSIQTVRSQLHEARQRLRVKLEPYFSADRPDLKGRRRQ